jgi:hypothetical protein
MQDVRQPSLSLRTRAFGITRVIGLLAVAVIVAIVAWRAPGVFRDLDSSAQTLAAMPASERDFLGARGADIDPRIFVAAKQRIATDETYAVITGDKVGVSTPNTLYAIAPFARYYLLPRRQTPEPSTADWIVSFGGDLDALGLRFAERVPISPGVELARVAR